MISEEDDSKVAFSYGDVNVGRYMPQDRARVIDFVGSTSRELAKKPLPLDDLVNIDDSFELFLVAKSDSEIVGTAGVKNQGDARLVRVYLRGDHRGNGLGSRLVQEILKYCEGKYKRIFLTTPPEMNAEGFYRKLGFETFRVDEKIWMEKNL